jgi:hypothetical protein
MSDRAFAAELVQAPALAVALIAEGPSEASGVKAGATGTVFVDDSVVGELWPSEFVERRQFAHRDVLENHGQKVVRIGRAAREIHDRLAGDDRIDANRAGGIRIGRRNSSPRRAGTNRDHSRSLRRYIFRDLNRGFAGEFHEHAVIFCRDRSFDNKKYFPALVSIADCNAASACAPEAAISVSW